ncbi:sugar O-acetyltransferase [Lactovum odontotermitis]
MVKKFIPKVLDETEKARLAKLDIFEKFEKGDWYCYGKEPLLQAIVKKSRQQLQALNALAAHDDDSAAQKLKEFLPGLSEDSEIYFPITSIEYPEKLSIGRGCFINFGLQIVSAGKVTIGSHCFIGPNCQLFTPNHHTSDKMLRREGWQYDAPITIGNDCWFGGSVIILPGVTIGDNVIVGAGAVVTKDVASNCVVAGNPAKIIKEQL